LRLLFNWKVEHSLTREVPFWGLVALAQGEISMSDQRWPRLSTVAAEANATVVRFTGGPIALTEANVSGLESVLAPLVGTDGQRRLVLDFTNVEFVSSAALDALVRLHLRLQSSGGSLAVRDLEEKVYEVFQVAELVQVFQVCPAQSASRSSD
jgi:anti-sigma B factor antagonist